MKYYNLDGTLNEELSTPGAEIPPVVPKWDAYDFKLRFTPDERVAIRSEAATDAYVSDFLDMLDTAAATNTLVHADDALVNMAFYLIEQAGILTEARSAEILGAES